MTHLPPRERRLGAAGPAVSGIGMGCMGLSFAYGHDTDGADPLRTLARAVELGVTFFDTADAYGPFTNEELVGRALAERRDDLVIATKFGVERRADGTTVGLNGSGEYVRRACEASLRRLGTDFVDLFLLHRLDPATPIEETVGAMGALVRAGLVRHIGICEAGPETIRRAHAVHGLAVVETEYSLWSRDVEDTVLPTLRELGIGLVAYSPLGRGFLTGRIRTAEDLAPDDFRLSTPRFQGENFERNLRVVDQVREIAAEKGATPAQLAIAWLLAQGDDVVPIQGATQVDQLEENLGAARLSLSAADLERIEAVAPRGSAAGERGPAAYMDQIDR